MDCCNYPEFRAQYGWECAPGYSPLPYTHLPYSPYAPAYYAPQAHQHYPRYAAAYHYDAYPTPHHSIPNDHVAPMEYGTYASKELRARRSLVRRDMRVRTPSHLPLTHTPPLECGVNDRVGGYCEPQMWPHYQSGMMGVNGWNGMSTFEGAWMSRGASCAREHLRHPPDISRTLKGSHIHSANHTCSPEERSTPFRIYEDPRMTPERSRTTPEFSSTNASTPVVPELNGASRDRLHPEARRVVPVEKKLPATVPLPAFQQAFGSTEIGRFAEAFSRTETVIEDTSSEMFPFEGFSDWENHREPQWSSQPIPREIKCDDNF